MSAASVIDDAIHQLQVRGAARRELEHARQVLAWALENNRACCRINLGRGVSAELPANPHAPGLRTASRIVTR